MNTSNKYFLEKSDENIKVADILDEGIMALSGQVLKPSNKQGREGQLGVFSKLLANTFTFLYDEPTFLKKYPHGFLTENAMFIPLDVYKDLLSREPQEKRDSKDIFLMVDCLLHINYLLTLIENQFQIQFSKEDRLAIFGEQNSKFTLWLKHMPMIDEVLAHPIEFVSVEEVKKQAKEAGISDETLEKLEQFKKDGDVINTILFKSQEVHNPESKLNILADKVIDRENQIAIDNMSVEEFKDIYQHGYSMKNTEDAYNILNSLVKDALNKSNEDQGLFVENLNEKWMPFIEILNDKHFFIAIENLGNVMEEKLGDKYESATREKIAHAVNELGSTSEYRRKYLIMSITDFSAMSNSHTRGLKAL